jgi:hypothetical protein
MVNASWEEKLRRTMSWVSLIGVAAFAIFFFYELAFISKLGLFDQLFLKHTPALVGLPIASAASLALVLLLRTVSGEIQVSLLGFQFKGAAGPLVMWILCFLAMTVAIRYTWPLL